MEIKISENALAEAFPAVDAGIRPFGSRVLVQIRTPRKISRGGIIIDLGTQETEKWNTQVAKVISVGPLAFKNRTTMEPWPEGAWCKPGDFVRVAKYGGDRWEISYGDIGEKAMFVIFNDLDIIGDVTGDPLAVKAFI
jgi:co-chaperonin GroES (HSP10)